MFFYLTVCHSVQNLNINTAVKELTMKPLKALFLSQLLTTAVKGDIDFDPDKWTITPDLHLASRIDHNELVAEFVQTFLSVEGRNWTVSGVCEHQLEAIASGKFLK